MKKIVLAVIVLMACTIIIADESVPDTAEDTTKHIIIKPIAISLGWDCEAAVRLRDAQLREQAFPFDWTQTADFNSIYHLIANNFPHFLSRPYLIRDGLNVRNVLYNINFGHDFPNTANIHVQPEADMVTAGIIVANFLDYLPAIEAKYHRRIQRLYEVLRSQRPIIFIRTGFITPNQATVFRNWLKAAYPHLKFLLVCVHKQPHFAYEWNISEVKSYYTTSVREETMYPVSWISRGEWLRIFKEIGLL